ncbi:MAG: hypothetical protein LW650_00945 [Planctomycetaceae bacterium]|jgi:hypothetical protein|nr:hypothetical protein [Planctomycetaceae bacterium]
MKTIVKLLGDLLKNQSAQPASNARELLSRAGGTDEAATPLEQLEARQLMFGATILPPIGAAGQAIPGTNLVFGGNNVVTLPRQGVPNGASVTTQFGYLVPMLSRDIQAFQPFQSVAEDFNDEPGTAGVTTPNTVVTQYTLGAAPAGGLRSGNGPAAGAFEGESRLRLRYYNYAAAPGGNAPALVTNPPAGGGTSSSGAGVRFTLTAQNVGGVNIAPVVSFSYGTATSNPELLNGGGASRYSPAQTASGIGRQRPMAGATVTLSTATVAGQPDTNMDAQLTFDANGIQTGATRIRLLYRGLDVTSQFRFARQTANPVPDPPTSDIVISRATPAQGGAPEDQFAFFDTIEFTRNTLGGGAAVAGTDTIFIDAISGVFAPSRFNQTVDARIFGAQMAVSGRSLFGLEQFDNSSLTSSSTGVYAFPATTRNGLSSRLLVRRNTDDVPTLGLSASQLAPLAGAAQNQALTFSVGGTQTVDLQFMPPAGQLQTARVMTAFGLTLPNTGTDGLDQFTSIQLFRNGTLVPFKLADGRQVLELTDDVFLQDPNLAAQFINQATGDAGSLQLMIRNDQGFDTVRILRRQPSVNPAAPNAPAITTTADQIQIDNVIGFFANAFVQDTYGRALQNTLTLGNGGDGEVLNVDLNGDGVPDFNDGIGRVDLLGVSSTSGITFIGGTVEEDANQNIVFVLPDSVQGIYGDIQQGGFGLAFPNGQGAQGGTNPGGLPIGTGSVIIGSPYVRDPRTPVTYHGVNPNVNTQIAFASIMPSVRQGANLVRVDQGPGGFSGGLVPTGTARAVAPALLDYNGQLLEDARDQFGRFTDGLPGDRALPSGLRMGIFAGTVDGVGQNLGSVSIHGMLFGSSAVAGTLRRFDVGVMLGSLDVRGDLGTLVVAGDLGNWQLPGAQATTDPVVATGNTIVVGRTVGQILIGGRATTPITVEGNINDPTLARLDFLRYGELEQVFNFDPPNQDPQRQVIGAVVGANGSAGQAAWFGAGVYRNDLLTGAEFVGAGNRGVIINGRLGLRDGVNTDEDNSDAFAFAAGVGQEVVLNVEFRDPPPPTPQPQSRERVYARVVDRNGNVVATHQFPFANPQAQSPQEITTARFRFTPTRTDVYFLVLSSPDDTATGQTGTAIDYTATISGNLPTTLGMYSSGSTSRVGSQVTVPSGDVGLIRVGAGFVAGDSSQAFSNGITSVSIESARDLASMRGLVVNVQSNVHGVLIGADFESGSLTIGGNLGTLATNAFGLFAAGNGDFNAGNIVVGGQIGAMVFAGGIGVQTNGTPRKTPGASGPVVIRTGNNGTPGHIGELSATNDMNGPAVTITTSANSRIDRFIIGGRVALFQPTIQMGAGSDIRFTQIGGNVTLGTGGATPNENAFLPLPSGTSQVFLDDSGASFTVTLPTGGSGQLRYLPVNVSQGITVGRIDITVPAGGNVTFTGVAPGVIALGLINITVDGGGGGGTARAGTITFTGPAGTEFDVLRMNVTGAARIVNNTVNGDFVMVDAGSLDTLEVTRGNLGSTEYAGQGTNTPGIGDRRFGQRVGNAGGLVNAIGGALGVDPAGFNVAGGGNRFGSDVVVPINWDSGTTSNSLEDLGSVMDPFLDGLVVRSGNVVSVRASGSIGDVILQGATGVLGTVVANTDNSTAENRFDGLVGNIYAAAITTVDVGDGLIGPGDSPFPVASVAASTLINSVVGGTRVRNPVISGLIISAGVGTPAAPLGINSVNITSGRIDGAFIGASAFDAWWRSARASQTNLNIGDSEIPAGRIGTVTGTGVSLTRSTIYGQNIGTVRFTSALSNGQRVGGNIDASRIEARSIEPVADDRTQGTIGTITADNFRNSTLGGEPLEFRQLLIQTTGNMANLQVTNSSVGVISDAIVDVGGFITGTVSARDIIRSNFRVDNRITSMTVTNDMRSTVVISGGLRSLTASGSIRSSTLTIAGPIETITVRGSIINGQISAEGPDGRISSITATNSIDANIFSSGTIGTISTTSGDISGRIETTDTADGNLNTLRSGRDMLATLRIRRDLGTVDAKGSIGRRLITSGDVVSTPDAIDVDGKITTLKAGAQLNADVRSASTIGTVNIGSVRRPFALPGSSAADQIGDPQIVAFGRITTVTVVGDFGGSILSHSGGIGTVTVTNGSIRRSALGNSVEARDGDITTVRVTNGNLFGSVVARDGSIGTIAVTGSGAFGNLGVDPTLASNTPVTGDSFRNQLPPGVVATAGIDGPRIWAGLDISSVTASGSAFEVGIYAGRTLATVNITGNLLSDSQTDAVTALRNTASYIAAGDGVNTVTIGGRAQGLAIIGGVASRNADFSPNFGADSRPGGAGANADSLQAGRVGNVTITGRNSTAPLSTNTVTITAGTTAGDDGVYASGDSNELSVPGLSTVGTVSVSGVVSTAVNARVSIAADTSLTNVTGSAAASVLQAFTNTVNSPVAFNGALPVGAGVTALPINGTVTQVTLPGGAGTIRIRLTGANVAAVYDQNTNRIIVRNSLTAPAGTGANQTRLATVSSLVIEPGSVTPASQLSNFDVVTSDDVTITTLTTALPFVGDSGIYVDGNVGTLGLTGGAVTTGDIRVGGDLTTANVGRAAPNLSTNRLNLLVGGNLGTLNATGGISAPSGGNARIEARSAGTIRTTGATGTPAGLTRTTVSILRDVTTVNIAGPMVFSQLRSGGSFTTVTTTGMENALVSARNDIRTTTVNGVMRESSILAGTDLGPDGLFTSVNSDDVTTNGNITTVTVTGQMIQSDVAAGVRRGVDGFLGTRDDIASDGRSTIGTVRVTGGIVGSQLQSESYRVISNGTVTSVISGSTSLANGQGVGNFRVTRLETVATGIQVVSLTVTEFARVYTARITFNQQINPLSLFDPANPSASALSIIDVRADGREFVLSNTGSDPDYRVSYDEATRTAIIVFNQAVTSRNNINNTPGFDTRPSQAGPGIYRFELSTSLRAVNQDGTIDGNSDGLPGDGYRFVTPVGDVGDRFFAGTGVAGPTLVTYTDPASLDVMMSDSGRAGALPAVGRTYTLRGVLGDHPDTSATNLSGSDVDLYSITLQAGQIIRLGALRGNAVAAAVNLLKMDTTGQGPGQLATATGALQALPVSDPEAGDVNGDQIFLVQQTGQYVLYVGSRDPLGTTSADVNPAFLPTQFTPSPLLDVAVVNVAPAPLATGSYDFSITISDDRNSGFAGRPLANGLGAPTASVPISSAAQFPLTQTHFMPAIAGDSFFAFTYNVGPDGIANLNPGTDGIVGTGDDSNDDVLIGESSDGGAGPALVRVERRAGADLIFGTADDQITLTLLQAAATVAGGNTPANLPGNADFATPASVVTRTASTGPDFQFVLNLGADGVRGLNGGVNDDIIRGTNIGTVITRTAGANNILGDGDDVITSSVNEPAAVPITDAPEASLANFPSLGSTVRTLSSDGSVWTWTLLPGADGIRNAPDPLVGDDIVFGTNGVLSLSFVEGALVSRSTVGLPERDAVVAAPLPYSDLFSDGNIVNVNSSVGAPFDFFLDAGGDRIRGIHNGVNDDVIIGANANNVVVTRTAGPDRIFNTADDIITPDTKVLSTVPAGSVPVPADFDTAGELANGITVASPLGPSVVYRLRQGTVPASSVAGGNTVANLPVPADFGAGVVTRAATVGVNFDFTLNLNGPGGADDTITGDNGLARVTRAAGIDNVLGTNDDVITSVALQHNTAVVGTTGTMNVVRTPGVDGVFGNGDDVITIASASASGIDLVTPPRPNDFAPAGTPTAQLPSVLAGPTATPSITIGEWRFTLDPGANGKFEGNGAGTVRSDDIVRGVSTGGQIIEYRANPTTGRFDGVANGDILTVNGATGEIGGKGAPRETRPDVDVFNLNGGQAILPGTRYRVTLKVQQNGGNFGSQVPEQFELNNQIGLRLRDLRGFVQFGLFERTVADQLANGQLLASPSEIDLLNPTPNRVVGESETTKYGYDANGDYYIEFTVPPSQGSATRPGSFAVYVQGAIQSDYGVEIVQLASISPVPQTRPQNILIETRGAIVNWLETGGRLTNLAAYDPSINGFTGLIGSQSILDYILNGNANRNQPGLIASLNQLFNGTPTSVTNLPANTVRFSANAADFSTERDRTSTVILSGSFEPPAFFNNGTFGATEGSDPFNARRTDQGVVFMPSLNALGNSPSADGVDRFIRQLTYIVGRQVGELLGLRITAPTGLFTIDTDGNPATPDAVVTDTMGDTGNAAALRPIPEVGAQPLPPATTVAGTGPRYLNLSRALAGQGSVNSGTQFFLGQQNSELLLRRIFGVR